MNPRDNQRGYGPPPTMSSFPPYQHQVNNPHAMLPPYNHQKDNLHGNQSMYDSDVGQMMYLSSIAPNNAEMYPPCPPVRNDFTHQQNSQMGYQHAASYQPVAQFPYPSHFSNYPPPPLPVQYQSKSLAATPEIGKDCKEMKLPPKDQETSPAKTKPEIAEEKEVKKPVPIMVGKRRGGRVLPTGVVKKQRTENQGQGRSDAWSQYMAEVRRYKEKSCEEERKNRPLVK